MGPFCVLDSVYIGRAQQLLCAAGARMLGKSQQKEMVENLLPRHTVGILEGPVLIL